MSEVSMSEQEISCQVRSLLERGIVEHRAYPKKELMGILSLYFPRDSMNKVFTCVQGLGMFIPDIIVPPKVPTIKVRLTEKPPRIKFEKEYSDVAEVFRCCTCGKTHSSWYEAEECCVKFRCTRCGVAWETRADAEKCFDIDLKLERWDKSIPLEKLLKMSTKEIDEFTHRKCVLIAEGGLK